MKSTMWFKRIDELQFLLIGKAQPSVGEWLAYCSTLRTAVAEDNLPKGFLTVTDGGGPDSKQRKELAVLAKAGSIPPGAICSGSMLARGITTAISWVVPASHMKSFGYDEIEAAYRWLPATRPSLEEVQRIVRETQQSCGFRVSNV
jgi:hypothetical protein